MEIFSERFGKYEMDILPTYSVNWSIGNDFSKKKAIRLQHLNAFFEFVHISSVYLRAVKTDAILYVQKHYFTFLSRGATMIEFWSGKTKINRTPFKEVGFAYI